MPKRPDQPNYTFDLDGSPEQLLRVQDLEAMNFMAAGTIRNRMSAGTCPIPFVKIGANVRFRLGDVRDFIAAQRSEV